MRETEKRETEKRQKESARRRRRAGGQKKNENTILRFAPRSSSCTRAAVCPPACLPLCLSVSLPLCFYLPACLSPNISILGIPTKSVSHLLDQVLVFVSCPACSALLSSSPPRRERQAACIDSTDRSETAFRPSYTHYAYGH